MSERFRHEDIASVPAGWKVRTVTTSGGHRVRVAFPPGRRVKGAGRLVSILHPLSGSNPCGNPCTLRSTNPQELMVMSANPPRRRTYGDYSLEKWGSKWVITKSGKVVTLPMTRKQAKAAIEWYARPNPSAESVRRELIEAEAKLSQARKDYADARTSSQKRKADAEIQFWGNKAAYLAAHTRSNPHELLIMGANPRVEVVHGENPPVEDIHEEFTGQEVKWIDVYNEPHMPAGRYAELGPLIALYVKPVKGGPVLRIGAPENHEDFADWWDKKPPIIVTDSSAKQIYFVDGCQNLTNLLEQFGAVENDRVWMLGQVRRIDYECRKEHVADPDEDRWKHDHGDEDGERPTLLFDARHKRMRYQGGNYRIEGPWIKN